MKKMDRNDDKLKKTAVIESASESEEISAPPMGLKVIAREFLKDKVAMAALIILIIILVTTAVWSIRLDANDVMRVDIFRNFEKPVDFQWSLIADAWNGEKTFLLGADEYGRDVFTQLLLAAWNSIVDRKSVV